MNLIRPMAACALSLALAAGTANAQGQWQGSGQDDWGQQRGQQQMGTGPQWGQQEFRGFEADQDRWRTTTSVPQLRGTSATLAQMGEEQDTFVRIEDGRIVSAYVDGRPVSPQDVQVRGNRIRVQDHRGDTAAIFRIPARGQLLGMPQQRFQQDQWDRQQRFQPGQQRFQQDQWEREQRFQPGQQRFQQDQWEREQRFQPGQQRFQQDQWQRDQQFQPGQQRFDQRGMRMDQQFDRPGMQQRLLGTPQAPVADLRTSAVGILMLEAQPHQLRGTGYDRGVRVDATQEGMPAHRAGLRRGDVIVAVDGREGVTPERLKNFLRSVPPGERITFTVIRDREEREVNVRTTTMLPAKTNWDYMQTGLDDRQLRQQQMMLDRQRQQRGFREGRIFGIGLTDADEDDLEQLEEFEEGLQVQYVNPGTILHDAGIRRGDIIVAVNGQSDITRDDVKEIMQDKEPGDQVRMLVLREGQLYSVNARIGRTQW